MFGMFKKKGAQAVAELKKFKNRDLAEGLVGACLLVAACDGEIEPKELAMLKEIGRTYGLNLSMYGIEG